MNNQWLNSWNQCYVLLSDGIVKCKGRHSHFLVIGPSRSPIANYWSSYSTWLSVLRTYCLL